MVGAIIVLTGFIANQRYGLPSDSIWFLLANCVGTAILAVVAGVNRDMGFLLVEGVWAIVSFVSIVRLYRGSGPPGKAVAVA
ncbi:MAG: CBU_0592 family membrane protein [Sporichthyaceae bacterium]